MHTKNCARIARIGLIIAGIGAILAGCTSPGLSPPTFELAPDQPPVFHPVDGVCRRAVVVGLTAVDPRAYRGWRGDCPGCDIDAEVFALLCREQGLQVAELHNNHATRDCVIATARAAWSYMTAGDLLVVYISGHGGQIADTDGDETDGQDETLCLWDGQLSDDVLRSLWQDLPAGLRVFYVTDTCNSGTNYKLKPRSMRGVIPRDYGGQLIHFGGCADGMSSYGSDSGGTWTTALIDAWHPGDTYRQWYEKAAIRMPREQIPHYAEYGQVTSKFRHGVALR